MPIVIVVERRLIAFDDDDGADLSFLFPVFEDEAVVGCFIEIRLEIITSYD